MVDESLPMSQKNIDSRPTSVDPKDATAHLGEETRNDEEPCYWSDMNLQDTGLYFDADEEISSIQGIVSSSLVLCANSKLVSKKDLTRWNF